MLRLHIEAGERRIDDVLFVKRDTNINLANIDSGAKLLTRKHSIQ